MNRIILIGNGFDLAHGLKTSYRDFINCFWNLLETKSDTEFVNRNEDHKKIISGVYIELELELAFKNHFLKHILKKAYLELWVDIENEYYTLLQDFLKEPRFPKFAKLWPTVKELNYEFCQVKNLLEGYLSDVCEKALLNLEPNKEIEQYLFLNGIERKSVAISKQTAYSDAIPEQKKKLLYLTQDFFKKGNNQSEQKKIQAVRMRSYEDIELRGIEPERILALNFNYTPTFERLYAPCAEVEIINIHGELNNPENPIVFGYGDELDDDYKEIEKTNDNDFLDNIKSIAYGNTNNYRRLLEFLQLDSYQVFVMGHSCGNSDRTLLNEIFEHPNCASIQLFYHKREDGSDDFSNVYKNISRNFNNKRALRDIVVNKEDCKPHPQRSQKPQP